MRMRSVGPLVVVLLGLGFLAGRWSVSDTSRGPPVLPSARSPEVVTAPLPAPTEAIPPSVVVYDDSVVIHEHTTVVQVAVDLRVDARDEAAVSGRLPVGSRVEVRQRRGPWALVRGEVAGQTVVWGWVFWALVQPVATASPLEAAPQKTGRIAGTVYFDGTPPVMEVPRQRAASEVCKASSLALDAVLVKDGRLQDVLVRLGNGAVKAGPPPSSPVTVVQSDCMYTPRIQGAVVGQAIVVSNGDETLHNVHTYQGLESWFNLAQPKGSDPLRKELPEDPTIVRFSCDVHPWMRAFVLVSNHPFFAVSDASGTFQIDDVPVGTYPVEAWHPTYGPKTGQVSVVEGEAAEVTFRYAGNEPEPPENRGELAAAR